ncbi:hypothetical protein [Flavonifractor plautii]|jgi:hypothetical protein|uniref:Uncharacterized protein n=1 Tax=Flavonifractor plautii TaxID=292800 RepID=A0AAW6CPW0_FLAPL|nr:hypothetical protein [Flavonifractor plautii]MDB7931290.1 hypothetical protein [Flavonifractor plautii]MDB7936240.1 hypothetical protein [Flavonifractor plautii]MDB7941238.1 hypothetical protein [Flavonifractor plautii]
MLYVWNKYYIKHVAKETVTSDKWYISFPVILCSGYTLDNQGKFYPTTTLSTLEDSRYLDRMPSSRDEYLIDHGKYIMYNAGDGGRWMVTDDSKLYHSEGSFRRYVAEETYGELIQTVTSRNEAEYPKNGVKDGYYYIYQSAKPEISSIDVPDAAMVGQTIDITWESADSAENYKLERRVDSGGWTQVYAGVALVYNDRAQAEWTSVQYRVSASISGVYGDPILSKTVNIVPSDALRVYMPEGNIGEIHGAITYTALALDLNRPIQVTEVFENTDSDYQRELTLKSGDSVTIPVSRFPSAAGGQFTVKAEQEIMDNSWISENRQLSYTKTPTSMPDSPYRVERLQGKECDVMPQTLAEVVFMPDGSSVADRLGGATLEGAALGTFTSSVALPFTPDVVWVIYGGEGANSIPPFAMLYPKVRAQISTGSNRSQYVTWDGSTNINSTGNPAQPLNYVALKFGGAS